MEYSIMWYNVLICRFFVSEAWVECSCSRRCIRITWRLKVQFSFVYSAVYPFHRNIDALWMSSFQVNFTQLCRCIHILSFLGTLESLPLNQLFIWILRHIVFFNNLKVRLIPHPKLTPQWKWEMKYKSRGFLSNLQC